MDLRHLRYFVAVADELHFGRAAERLGIQQPPLSQQIQALEKELGARLFERGSRKVALTPIGALFLVEARATLAQAERAVAVVRRARDGEIGEIRLGFTASSPFTPVMPQVIYAFRRRFPEVHLKLVGMTTREQLAALAARQLDLAFVRSPFAPIPPEVAALTVVADRLMLVCRTEHPLAALPVVPVAAIANEPFIMFERDAGTGLWDQVVAICADHGFSPTVAQEAREAPTLIGLVAAGLGITILPDSLRRVQVEGVVYRPLDTPLAASTVLLAHRRDETAGAVRAFIRLVEETVAD
ncbi:transcriptional regulator [Aliidongia dinghuensis]|uniref:Transcriptional regulator n=1 Tax=Aliidongia dinghuensis TaxID=1867774 RepID=A0A8J2YWW8_9PROT|nr:LysR family transcriptional regulator [Aliidongia dinghuensis]GGF34116.1 transcriptional regulator [Aliidongia dinghuensis]